MYALQARRMEGVAGMTCRVAPSRRNAEVAEEEDGMLCYVFNSRRGEGEGEEEGEGREIGKRALWLETLPGTAKPT